MIPMRLRPTQSGQSSQSGQSATRACGSAADTAGEEVQSRLDALYRALAERGDPSDGLPPALDNPLLAAAAIQASINRQRHRPEPTTEAPARQTPSLPAASLLCVLAVVIVALLWEFGPRTALPLDPSIEFGMAQPAGSWAAAGQLPVAASTSPSDPSQAAGLQRPEATAPGGWTAPGSTVTATPRRTPAVVIAPTPGPYPMLPTEVSADLSPGDSGRRLLVQGRERPAPRHHASDSAPLAAR